MAGECCSLRGGRRRLATAVVLFFGSGVSRVSLTTEVTEATEVGAAVNGCFAQQRRVALLACCGVVF